VTFEAQAAVIDASTTQIAVAFTRRLRNVYASALRRR
jgi:hypothetical protein